MRAGALDLAGAVRQQMALALGATPIVALVPPLVFPIPSTFCAYWICLIAESRRRSLVS